MPGLYIHIPFCKSRCIYCGFYSTTGGKAAERYVNALIAELELRRGYIGGPPTTIYIGGGTPSQLSPALLGRLLAAIDTGSAVEVTIECNPDDVTEEFARALGRLPVSRVSMGAQTFDEARLRFLRRRHGAEDVAAAIGRLRSAGIGNISIDLMYGFPNETMEQWRADISCALSLAPEHISAYCLSYEDGTPLHAMLKRGLVAEADEETCRAMYYELADRLTAAGYEHYEISNFALPGRRSRHNSGYWLQEPYLGLGAAAHSFDGQSRQWNVADLDRYIAAIERGEVPAEREELDTSARYNDTVMLSLRTCEGIDLARLRRNFGPGLLALCLGAARPYLADGLLERRGNHLRLTRRGLFVSDMIMSDLMDA